MADPRDHRALSRALNAVTRILGTGNTEGETSIRRRHEQSAIVDCALYVGGERQPGDWHYDEALATARRRQDGFVWVGLHEPAEDELADIANTFELHELAVEDALKEFQRPKIERYGDILFAVVRTTRYVEHTELTESSEVVETGSVCLFLGQHFVITIRTGSGGELHSVRGMLEDRPELLAQGPWSVAHAVYDRIVDSYLDCAAAVEVDLDELEESVFGRSERRGGIQRIYQLKRELVEFRRAVVPLQRPLDGIVHGRIPEVPKEVRRYFRDVTDHLSRTVEQVQSFEELLNSILQARLAQVSVEQNDDMRKIAAWAGIAAVWTSVAGIYGMNFDVLPEKHWKYGYPMVWAFCVIASLVLYRFFRRNNWL
jgi:magnesium transporter